MALCVFITGASSGIGEALARAYAHDPATVIGLAARRIDRLAGLRDALGASRCFCHEVDVTEPDSIRTAATAFERQAGVPDIVIGNAGVSAGTVTGEPGDAAVFARIVQTNLTGLADTFDAFLPAIRSRGAGTLVGIASVAGIRGLPGAGAYSASKAGAIAYLESLRVELASTRIRVVTLAPGYIRTPMTEHNRYPMPFLMDADRFAAAALRCIARGRSYAVIPWQMRLVSIALRGLPNPVYDLAFRKAPRKARLSE